MLKTEKTGVKAPFRLHGSTSQSLDLSNLVFADSTAIEVIQSLREKGAGVSGASPFIKYLIDG